MEAIVGLGMLLQIKEMAYPIRHIRLSSYRAPLGLFSELLRPCNFGGYCRRNTIRGTSWSRTRNSRRKRVSLSPARVLVVLTLLRLGMLLPAIIEPVMLLLLPGILVLLVELVLLVRLTGL